jgi:hypothetical protein
VLINDDEMFVHAKNNLDIIDMFDDDIEGIYNENRKMMDVDMPNI